MIKITARDRLRLLAGGGAMLLFGGCGGGSGSEGLPFPINITGGGDSGGGDGNGGGDGGGGDGGGGDGGEGGLSTRTSELGLTTGLLRDTYRNNFKVGTAMTSFQLDPEGEYPLSLSAEIAKDQFNMLTPEFELKADQLAPTEGVYNFDAADRLVDWAIENGMEVRGHALVWHHPATPAYFFEGTLTQIRVKLENYITNVMQHFKGRIKYWDVANEVVEWNIYDNDPSLGPFNTSTNWYQAVGSADFVDWAFRAARAADPDAKLFLSDYRTQNARKISWIIQILRGFKERGVPIDGIGHQGHMFIDEDAASLLASIDAVDNEYMGLINHLTEMDTTYYRDPGQCWTDQNGCLDELLEAPPELAARHAQTLRDIFNGCAARPSVESLTMWGVKDDDSWYNTEPIVRSNFPLLFDVNGRPKAPYHAITDPNYIIPTE